MEQCTQRVIALGFFDGVHLGHAALLKKTTEVSRLKGLTPSVMTFDTHPDNLLAGSDVVPLITSREDRAETIRREFGIDDVIFLHFDRELMQMPWAEFVEHIASKYSAAHLVAGHDFTFGFKGEGNAAKLKAKCAEMGIGCDIISKVELDGRTVSSTYIRELIAEGRFEEAERFLGHPYSLSGEVREGYHLGRTIDSPTANLFYEDGVLIPAHGVYATRVFLPDGERRLGVTNVGVRPTVSDGDRVTAETFILDWSGDIYGERIRLEFLKMLRPEMKFSGIDELKAHIQHDADTVRSLGYSL